MLLFSPTGIDFVCLPSPVLCCDAMQFARELKDSYLSCGPTFLQSRSLRTQRPTVQSNKRTKGVPHPKLRRNTIISRQASTSTAAQAIVPQHGANRDSISPVARATLYFFLPSNGSCEGCTLCSTGRLGCASTRARPISARSSSTMAQRVLYGQHSRDPPGCVAAALDKIIGRAASTLVGS